MFLFSTEIEVGSIRYLDQMKALFVAIQNISYGSGWSNVESNKTYGMDSSTNLIKLILIIWKKKKKYRRH